MPIPVNNSWRTRSIVSVRYEDGSCSTRQERAGLPESRGRPAAVLAAGFDMLVENDIALFVPHDVVAVKPVAVLVEIIFALGAREFPDSQDRFADLAGVGRIGRLD